jgi:outer membrane protein assembly factor BamB
VVGWKGIVFALDSDSGRLLWSANYERAENGRASPWASPVMHDGTLYVAGEHGITVFKAGREAVPLVSYSIPDGAYPSVVSHNSVD